MSLSIFMKAGCIRVSASDLEKIGSPRRICFMVDEDMHHLIISPYDKVDLKSHYVSPEVYVSTRYMRVYSKKLCCMLYEKCGWEKCVSYKLTGNLVNNKVLFNLADAIQIK